MTILGHTRVLASPSLSLSYSLWLVLSLCLLITLYLVYAFLFYSLILSLSHCSVLLIYTRKEASENVWESERERESYRERERERGRRHSVLSRHVCKFPLSLSLSLSPAHWLRCFFKRISLVVELTPRANRTSNFNHCCFIKSGLINLNPVRL